MKAAALGFDLGGGTLKAACVSGSGGLLHTLTRPTGEASTPQSISASLVSARDALCAKAGVAKAALPCGLGFAGVLDESGSLAGSPNLPLLVATPLARLACDALACTVTVDNDANCAALAEAWVGAARGESDAMVLTLGTGLGSGLILGGNLHRGSTGRGCEFGHSVVVRGGRKCGCGNNGCVEAYVSEAAAEAALEEAGKGLRESVAPMLTPGHGCAEALFALAVAGNAEAEAITSEMVDILGTAVASAANTFDVELFVLGGGLAPAFVARRENLIAAVARSLFARPVGRIRVVRAEGGPWAGAIGAARLALLAS